MKNAKDKNLRKMRGRKGIIDVQFNWIFILIAGFVIFLFIISLVFSQKRNAESQTNIMAVNQVTTLLKSKQQTADVYSEINLPRTNINFRCDLDAEYFSYKLAGSERVTLPTEIIFSPQELSSNKILIWSKAFDAGFPVSVFTYIATPNSMIIIYNNSVNGGCSRASQFYAALPNNISKLMTNDTVKITSYGKKKIVCFDGCDCPRASLNFDYINITSATASQLFGYGNVTFHRKGSIDIKKPYIGEAGLFGAVFSDTPEYYSCQMSRALKQFEIKRSLVEKRLKMMQMDMNAGGGIGNSCSIKFDVVLDDSIIPLSNITFNYGNMTNMYKLSKELNDLNIELTLNSCPKIY